MVTEMKPATGRRRRGRRGRTGVAEGGPLFCSVLDVGIPTEMTPCHEDGGGRHGGWSGAKGGRRWRRFHTV
ncbi:hypothetical protein HanRHA438_Chr01g0000761 [Helianthus annuus]|nr:hypothetical protein HanIR_Chr01g0000841 [Helianthus annuus]KAJ0946144.1 hypothetical protein HanRHA438_Chr01g0000761 [Helianthus annuus]